MASEKMTQLRRHESGGCWLPLFLFSVLMAFFLFLMAINIWGTVVSVP